MVILIHDALHFYKLLFIIIYQNNTFVITLWRSSNRSWAKNINPIIQEKHLVFEQIKPYLID